MKRLSAFIICMFIANILFSQCDKNVVFVSNSVSVIKPDGSIENKVAANSTINFKDKSITIYSSYQNDADTLDGYIKNVVDCKWNEFLKNGYAKYNVTMRKRKPGENFSEAAIEIKSQNGKTSVIIEGTPKENKLQFDINEYKIE